MCVFQCVYLKMGDGNWEFDDEGEIKRKIKSNTYRTIILQSNNL